MTTYADLAKKFSLAERIQMFGSVFSKKRRAQVSFDLWSMQKTMLDVIDRNMRKGIWQTFLPKARQLGQSELAAEHGKDSAYIYGKFEITVISKRSEDAEYLLAKRVLPKLLFDQENIPRMCKMLGLPSLSFPKLVWPTEPKAYVDKIVLENGSIFKALSATNNSGASMTSDAVICDEAGGFDEVGDLKTLLGNLEPVVEEAVRAGIGWMKVIGTSEPGSSFNEIVRELWKTPEKFPTRQLIFLPWQCKPSRTPEWYDQQLAKDPIMTRLQYPASLDDFFTVKTGLIYPQFDERHVFDFEPGPTDQLYVLFDQGYKHGSAILFMFYDKTRRIVKIRHELHYEMTEVATIAVELKRFMRKNDLRAKEMIADTSIFKETGVISIDKVFQKQGIRWKPAFKSDEQGGIDLISGLLKRNRIVIHPECRNLIFEFENWKWHKNGRYPEDANNDALDALRYGVTAIFGQGGAGSERYEPRDPYDHVGYVPGFELRPSGVYVPEKRSEDWEMAAGF